MKKLIRHTLGLLAMSLTGQGTAATYTTPDGMWDIVSSGSMTIQIQTGKKTETLNPVLTQSQYLPNKTYKSYDWFGIPATWRQSESSYQVTLDIAKIDTGTNTPEYINRMIKTFNKYAAVRYGSAPALTSIRTHSFLDTASLTNGGLQLKGTLQSVLRVNYTDPKTRRAATATLTTKGSYLGNRASAPSSCCTSTDPLTNLVQSQVFLDKNAQLPGIVKTTTGLQYKIIQKASGANPKPLATDTVKVSYRGYLPSGQVFDSNAGISFPLNGVISGWTEGLQLMSVGDYFRFYIPPELAYGDRTIGSYIKPNSALVFDVILEAIE